MTRMLEPVVGILFPQITRYDADKSILDCLKFLLNYGFYKFGVEVRLFSPIIKKIKSILYSNCNDLNVSPCLPSRSR